MLFAGKERLEGLKHNISFEGGGGGVGTPGEGIGLSTIQKGVIL